jgi:hypothetical protein
MSDLDPESLEQELGKLRPAKPPQELMQRMSAAAPIARRQSLPVRFEWFSSWRVGLGWAGAATAGILVLIGMNYHAPHREPVHDQVHLALKPATASLIADKVEINQQLLTSFDAVAQLPDGEPVRLRCREWLDAVVLRDSARGVVIERHAPRLEVVPVRFEIY